MLAFNVEIEFPWGVVNNKRKLQSPRRGHIKNVEQGEYFVRKRNRFQMIFF